MVSARELLAQAQIQRPEMNRLAEAAERATGNQVVQFQPTANTRDGVVGATSNGGKLTVFNGAQNFTPETQGQSYQLQLSSSRATLVANSRPQETTGQANNIQPIIATRPPTAEDAGQRGQLWLEIGPPILSQQQVAAWIYVAELGAYARLGGGGAEEINGYIDPPIQGTAYPIISSATYPSAIASLSITVDGATVTTANAADTNVTVGNTTVEINKAIGATLAAGESLTLTPTATDGEPISFTIGFLR